jgi:uncharacterized membrane protein
VSFTATGGREVARFAAGFRQELKERTMFGLTTLGTIHTAIGLVALIAGAWALARDKAIEPGTTAGKVYIWMTVLTCLTGFPIFQHGGFGPPHILGILTLLVLGIAALARRSFGRAGPYVETLAYSFSFFLHFIPGTTETFTRMPQGAPLFSGPEDPALAKTIGVLFLIFAVGAWLQVRRMRAGSGAAGVVRVA